MRSRTANGPCSTCSTAGLEATEIAERLVVSIDTVRSHVKSLHRKLGVHSREELVGAIRALRAPASPQLRGR